MAEVSFLAKLGLRIGVLGSSASLALAAPIAAGSIDPASQTAANRTGLYFDQTAAAEQIGVVVGGQTGPLFMRNGSVVDVQMTGALSVVGTSFGSIAVSESTNTGQALVRMANDSGNNFALGINGSAAAAAYLFNPDASTFLTNASLATAEQQSIGDLAIGTGATATQKTYVFGLFNTGTLKRIPLSITSLSGFELCPRGTAAGSTGLILMRELFANGTNAVGFKAPDALAADTVYVLPTAFAGGNGYALTSTTTGVMSWTDVSTLAALTATYVGYGSVGNTLTGDSGFTRTALALVLDANTDNTLTTGYGRLGLATSGTSTSFYVAQASNYNSTDFSVRQDSAGRTTINSKTGVATLFTVNGSTSASVSSSLFFVGAGIGFQVANTTDGTSGSAGAFNTAGGVGITKAVWVGTNVTWANGVASGTVTDAATNATTTMLTLAHLSSGTVANSFGTQVLFKLHDDGGTSQNALAINVIWSVAASATRTSAIQFQTVNSAGALTTKLTVGGAQVTTPTSCLVVIQDTTASTTTTTGALTVAGGMGVAGSCQADVFKTGTSASSRFLCPGAPTTAAATGNVAMWRSGGTIGAAGDMILQTDVAGNGSFIFRAGTTTAVTVATVSGLGSIVPGNAALALSATDGFVYMASGAGTPSGVPTTFTGRLAFYYDSTNNLIYIYNGAWKKTAALT